MARRVWADAGVVPEITEETEGQTGAALIFVETGTGDNAIVIAPGAAANISETDVEARRALIEGAAVFVTQLEQPLAAARLGLKIAKAAGVVTVFNPAPASALPGGMLADCDYVTPNETEAVILTGRPVGTLGEAEAAAGALLAAGAGAVALTLGAQGVLYRDAGRTAHIPAMAAGPVVETTGAGDAFNGGFAVALAEGMDPVASVRFGCATAGISVTRAGAAPSMPSRAEINAVLARYPPA